MSFEDLPPDWPRRPVTDPAITADLLDLFVGDRDRAVGAVGILLCGREGRLLQPVVVETPAEGQAADIAFLRERLTGSAVAAGGGSPPGPRRDP